MTIIVGTSSWIERCLQCLRGGFRVGRPLITEPLEDILKRDFSYCPRSGLLFRKGKECGAPDTKGYLIVSVRRKSLKVHRVCWFLHYGVWPSGVIDHINRVTDDNRLCNIRDVSQKVNTRNSKIRADNKSGYKGVSWDKARNSWVAREKVEGVYKFRGYHRCPTAAYLTLQRFQTEGRLE